MILWARCPLSISLCNQHPPFDEPRFKVTEPLNGCGTNRYQEYRPWFPILRRLVTVRATLGKTSRNFQKTCISAFSATGRGHGPNMDGKMTMPSSDFPLLTWVVKLKCVFVCVRARVHVGAHAYIHTHIYPQMSNGVSDPCGWSYSHLWLFRCECRLQIPISS